jgi:hypothetical protein
MPPIPTPEIIALAATLTEPEWLDWYMMTPEERMEASAKLWVEYLALGGSLNPEVDLQSPFWTEEDYKAFAEGRL